jgi:hypothetical protein
MQISW